MKVRYYIDGVDILSDDTTVVAQSTYYWFVEIGKKYIPEFDDTGILLLAIRKCQVPVEIRDNADDNPPRIFAYFNDHMVSDIVFHQPSLDNINRYSIPLCARMGLLC